MSNYVADEVVAERRRQDDKWGEQNHPDHPGGFGWFTRLPSAESARIWCDAAAAAGRVTFAHIALEEFCEAMDEAAAGNVDALRTELVQTAAVLVSWVEAIDRRRAREAGAAA